MSNSISPTEFVQSLTHKSRTMIIFFLQKKLGWDFIGAKNFVWKVHPGYSKRFHFSRFWKNWNRVIKNGNSVLEISLTPFLKEYEYKSESGEKVHIIEKDSWENISDIILNYHNTAADLPDIDCDEIPMCVISKMKENLDEETVNFLLYGDILSLVNFEKLQQLGGQVKLCDLLISNKVA